MEELFVRTCFTPSPDIIPNQKPKTNYSQFYIKMEKKGIAKASILH